MIVFGLSKADFSKPTTTEVGELPVHDGKGGWAIVRVGDKVEIFEPNKNRCTLQYLGPGPYTITWLARWRCGMGFLQLTAPTEGNGLGVNASKIKIVS